MNCGECDVLNGFYNLIRNQDMFGHKISLNFNKRGNEHKTCIGGLCSIALFVLIVVHIGLVCDWLANDVPEKVTETVT